MSEVRRATVAYPGGLTARYRWGGTDSAAEVFASSEGVGSLTDHALLAGSGSERLCRAELRVEGPLGSWTARFASAIYDEPAGVLWDSAALLVIAYGFLAYALASRTGELRWAHKAGTPMVAVLASTQLPHVVIQTEVETLALDPKGAVRWRIAHGDVVAAAELVAGRLALTAYAGGVSLVDPLTGRALPA